MGRHYRVAATLKRATAMAFCLCLGMFMTACSQTIKSLTNNGDQQSSIPQEPDQGSIHQLAKSEIDRFADIEIRRNIDSLRTIMLKLYKRNPAELRKTRFNTPKEMVRFIFDQAQQHGYHFKSLNHLQGKQAIFLAFEPNFEGDRVLAFVVGLQTMLLKAHGGKSAFYLTHDLDPQIIYHYARNLEIAAWKLSHAKRDNGKPFLISNSMSKQANNLSIEREFGKMIGRTDLFAYALSESSQRTITRVIQNVASTLFLPI